MILARPTLPDLLALCLAARPDEIAQHEALVGAWDAQEAAAWHFRRPGVKFALLDASGAAVCAGGWDEAAPGVWQDWMVGSADGWCRHWRSITRESRKVVKAMFATMGARRLQIQALASRTAAAEWYERGLGFRREGMLRGYGVNGEDVAMFARLAGDA